MNSLLILVFVAFLESQCLATAETEPTPAPVVKPAGLRKLQACPGQIIKILCKAREGPGEAEAMLLADCYMVNIGGKKHTELTGENLLLKVEKNTTVEDDEGTHLTAQLMFQTECGATGEFISAMFRFLTDKNDRDFDPCQYLDSALMITALAATLVVVQLVVYYITK